MSVPFCSVCIPVLPAFSFSATGCAQLSYFGSGCGLWGQRLGIGGEYQVTFRNSDDSAALIPTPSPHPFLASTLGTKKGKKQQDDENQQLPLQTQAGGWVCLFRLFSLLCSYPSTSPPSTLNKMDGIFRMLCYREWLRHLQFTQYLGEREWDTRENGTAPGT